MIVISDTTPIITLLKLNHLDLLCDLYGTVYVPQSVYDELTLNQKFSVESDIIQKSLYLEVFDLISDAEIDSFRHQTGLDCGESEAILLAEKVNAELLLIDESHGRSVALSKGLRITGVIGVLMSAYKMQMITDSEVRHCIEIMKKSNRFISEKVYAHLLNLLDEKD